MFKLLLVTYLCYSAYALDTCYVNLGNLRQVTDPILDQGDTSVSLEECKYYCDIWDTRCAEIEGSPTDCHDFGCHAGVLTTGGCILYPAFADDYWEQYSDDSRDQAFRTCDDSCWEELNGQINTDTSLDLLILEGEYTSPECKAECENFNADCWDIGCQLGCGGVRISSAECVLTATTDLFDYTDDETAHYRKYICDIPDGTTGSIQVVHPESSTSEIEEEEQEEQEEQSTDTYEEEATETDENVIIDENGDATCTVAEVFSECDYKGDSAVVNIFVMELTWEPKSWCVPEFQTLVLHNAYNLEGETSEYEDSVSCAESINYTFLQLQKKKQYSNKKVSIKA